MPDPIINGTKGAYLQPKVIGWSESGEFVILTWQGTRDEIANLAAGIVASGGLFDLQESFSGAADKIVARFAVQQGTAEQPVNDWEIFYQEVEKDLLECDLAPVNAMDAATKKAIRDSIDGTSNTSPTILASIPGAIAIYSCMVAGQTSKILEAPVLRHTVTCSKFYSLTGYAANAGKIFSGATLVSQETPWQQVIDQMPSDTDPVMADGRTVHYGWLKKRPTVRVSLHQKTQLVQEFHYGLWDQTAYSVPL